MFYLNDGDDNNDV